MRRDSYLRLVKKLKSPPPAESEKKDTAAKLADSNSIGNSLVSLGRKSSTLFTSNETDEGKKNLKKVSRKLQRMSDDDLRMLFSPADDNFVYDCLIDTIPMINRLKQERDNLQQQVSDLARFNHAREPEFARDRKKLRDTINEVELLKRRVASETMLPIVNKLGQKQTVVAETRKSLEKESKLIKDEFLTGQKVYHDQKDFDDFIERYIKTQREAIKWSWMEKLANKGKANLEEHVPKPLALTSSRSPIAPRRQRKRVSFDN